MSDAAAEEKKEEESPTEGAATSGAEGATEAPKKGFPIKLVLFILIPVLLLGGAAGFLFLTDMGKSLIGMESNEGKAKPELPEHIAYVELPEMLVNIQSSEKRRPYLRLMIQLELQDPKAVTELDKVKPRVIDAFQTYLRELRIEDLEGSAGSQRLKQELLKRAKAICAPIEISDVLFTNFVVQ